MKEFIEFAEAVITTATTAKRTMCAHEGGPADGMPLLIWETKEETLIIPVPVPDDEEASFPEVMDYVLKEIWTELGTPINGAIVTEAFVQNMNTTERTNVKRGSLAKEFSENPKDIGECLVVFAFNTAGRIRHSVSNYKYNDIGQPEFDEIAHSEGDDCRGQLTEVVRAFLDLINVR